MLFLSIIWPSNFENEIIVETRRFDAQYYNYETGIENMAY